MRPRLPRLPLLLGLLGLLAGCAAQDPCERLAERDCRRFGHDSAQCREARDRTRSSDRFLIEMCLRVLDQGDRAWGPRDAPGR